MKLSIKGLVFFIIFIIAMNFYIFVRSSMRHGMAVFKRLWSMVDFFIILLNILIIMNQLDQHEVISVQRLRVIEAFLMILMWFKSLYYLSLVGEISPLVDSVFMILNDIKYFMIIYIIALMAFVNAFYVIGKN